MGLNKELWLDEIEEGLMQAYDWMNLCVDLSDRVSINQEGSAAIVHMPVAGADPNIVVDRTVLPATITQRTDTEKTFAMHSLTSDPQLVTALETKNLAYDKSESIRRRIVAKMSDTAAKLLSVEWAATDSNHIIRTTGADSALALAPGATGTRKMLTKENILTMANIFDTDKVPATERYALIPHTMLADLLKDSDVKNSLMIGNTDAIVKGEVGMLYGFKIYKTVDNVPYTAAGAPKAFGAAGAATDELAAQFWHRDFVCKAQSALTTFEDNDRPEYYAKMIISSLLWFGGRKLRADNKGVGAIAQVA